MEPMAEHLTGLVDAFESLRGRAVTEPLRLSYGSETVGGVEALRALVVGSCPAMCARGWRVDDPARRCPKCGPMRVFTEGMAVANLPRVAEHVLDRWAGEVPLESVQKSARAMVADGRGPLLMGDAGRGKTWTALAMALTILRDGRRVRWVKWPALMGQLKATFGTPRQPADVLRPLGLCEALFIDDMGVGKSSEWAEEIAYMLIDQRSENGRPIAATSNLSERELEMHFGSRVWSRLGAVCRVVKVDGKSRR